MFNVKSQYIAVFIEWTLTYLYTKHLKLPTPDK